MDTMMSQWKANVDKHQKSLVDYAHVLKFRESEMKTVQRKLDYVSEFMRYAKKQEDKLKSKRVKLLNETSRFDQWENPNLTSKFSADQIKKLVSTDKNAALQMILPKE